MQRRRLGANRKGGRKPSRALRGSKANPTSNPHLQFVRTGAFVPSKFRTSFRISAAFAIAASSTNTNTVLSGNNLFDPLLSSGTRRCAGWTQMAGLWTRYRVLGSRIEVKAQMSASATAGVTQIAGAICVYPSNTGIGATSFIDNNTRPYVKFADINSGAPRSLVLVAQTSKFTGNKSIEGSDRSQATIASAPGEEWYWIISAVSDAAYTNGQVVFDINITYDTELFDRYELDPTALDLYEQIYKHNCDMLRKTVPKPHNDKLPWNEAKMGVVEQTEAKKFAEESKLDVKLGEQLVTDLKEEESIWKFGGPTAPQGKYVLVKQKAASHK